MTKPDQLEPAPTALEPRALRRALGNFVTGVTVVTTMDETGGPRGLTANSFTSVSLDPPLVLVCIANTSSSLAVFQRCEGFAVNVLSEEQRWISDVFASRVGDRFEGIEWRSGTTGAPAIDGSLVSFDCLAHQHISAGDHVILVGQVVDYRTVAGRPLIYGQGGYVSASMQQAVVSQTQGRQVVASCIAEHSGRVFLVRAGDEWGLPEAVLPGEDARGLSPLAERFCRFGANVEITFLYSVFESIHPSLFHVVYRGELRDMPEHRDGARLFDEAEIPWDHLASRQLGSMLRRFFHERAVDQFGVYSEFSGSGRVARLHRDTESFDRYLSQIQDH